MSADHQILSSWFSSNLNRKIIDMGKIKRALSEEGVNSRGWRLYADYGDHLIEPLDRPFFMPGARNHNRKNAVSFLKLLAACEMDVPPPYKLLQSMRVWNIPGNQIELIPVHFFRALWKACIKKEYQSEGDPEEIVEFIDMSLVPVARWFFSTAQHEEANQNLLKAGFESLEERFLDWKVNYLLQKERIHAHPPEWSTFIRRVELNGYRFNALVSYPALLLESEEMFNCIDTYSSRCLKEMLRVYSVVEIRSGKRVATMAVAETEAGSWVVEDIKAAKNAEPHESIVMAAEGVIFALQEAYETLPIIRDQMDDVRVESGS